MMSQKRTLAILAVILGMGLVIRLLHFWFVVETAFPRIPLVHTQSDMYAFWQWAQTIVAGDWLGRDTYHPYFNWMRELSTLERLYSLWGGKEVYHQAPLYPYFLALVLSFHNAPAFASLIQLIVGALQPLVLFFLARRLFDTRVGLVAAALTALYGPFVFYQTTLLRDWLPPLLEPLILLLVLRAEERRQTLDWLMAGVAMGAGLLTKETTLAVSVMALLWLILRHRFAWHVLGRPLILLATGFLVCLAPLFARNVAVGAPPFAISGQGAGNVVIGFAPDMPPAGFSRPSEGALEITRQSGGDVWSILMEIVCRHDLSELFSHEWLKLRAIIDPFEVWNNANYYYGLDISPVLQATLGYGVIFPLGVAGALILLPSWRRTGLFYAYLFASVAVQMVTIVLARFRLSLIPVLILGAAFLIVQLFSAIRGKQLSRALVLVVLVSAISLFQQVVAPLSPGRTHTSPNEYLLAAKVHAQDKRYDLALRELARLREKLGQRTPRVVEGHMRVKWAADLLLNGNREAARRQLRLAEKIYAATHDDSGTSLYNLGLVYTMLGDRNRARALFEEYLNRYPQGSKAREIRDLLSRSPTLSPGSGR